MVLVAFPNMCENMDQQKQQHPSDQINLPLKIAAIWAIISADGFPHTASTLWLVPISLVDPADKATPTFSMLIFYQQSWVEKL